jgi:hypothetical protein
MHTSKLDKTLFLTCYSHLWIYVSTCCAKKLFFYFLKTLMNTPLWSNFKNYYLTYSQNVFHMGNTTYKLWPRSFKKFQVDFLFSII